jgi:MerR family transcriptional regulator, heat shock protein HspR
MANRAKIENKTLDTERTFTIGEAADVLGISVPLLRLYEREGLILPFRRESKHRRYTNTDLERIRCMRDMINNKKVSIAGIQHLLSLIPCWKIKECPEGIRIGCPAFRQHAAPCWMISNKPWKCRNEECRLCAVYTEFSNCHSLKQFIARSTTS